MGVAVSIFLRLGFRWLRSCLLRWLRFDLRGSLLIGLRRRGPLRLDTCFRSRPLFHPTLRRWTSLRRPLGGSLSRMPNRLRLTAWLAVTRGSARAPGTSERWVAGARYAVVRGRVAANVCGRPLFTEANCARLLSVWRMWFTCSGTGAIRCSLRTANSEGVGRTPRPPRPPS
jgi:hypothetical protein